MRKIKVLTFISLDGVMQAPGGPEEDTSGGFKYGGWTFPYFDEFSGEVMAQQMGVPFDLLLGRRTYEIFSAYWPDHDDEVGKPLNRAKKYVASGTLKKVDWNNSELLKNDIVPEIKKLKEQDGPEIRFTAAEI